MWSARLQLPSVNTEKSSLRSESQQPLARSAVWNRISPVIPLGCPAKELDGVPTVRASTGNLRPPINDGYLKKMKSVN